MKYYKCKKCELNYVTEEDAICDICKKNKFEYDDDDNILLCPECGEILKPNEKDYCEYCKRKLKNSENITIVYDDFIDIDIF